MSIRFLYGTGKGFQGVLLGASWKNSSTEMIGVGGE
jgi:hypothetical protein